MKRAIAAFYAFLFLLTVICYPAFAEGRNLLKNGGFENVSDTGMPSNWFSTAYRSQDGYSRLTATDEKAHTGQYSALVENASLNDARFTCTVKVDPDSLYRLSGYVLVENMEETGNGANFGIEGIYSFSDCLFDTNGQWQYLEWYGETGEDQREVTLGIRIGGYSAESVGKAYFDDIVLEKVEILPKNVVASLWYNANISLASNEKEEAAVQKSTVLFVLLGIAFILLTTVLGSIFEKKGKFHFEIPVFAVLLLLALLLRVILAIRVEGYEVDINCFKAWSIRIARLGPSAFYAPDYFCDYPPGAILLLWPVGVLLNAFGSQNGVSLLIVKMLPLLCDLAGALCLWFYTRKKWSSYAAFAATILYLFNPAALINGAAWGQMDSVLALLILLTTFAALEKKWYAAIPLFVVSVLVKPQALLFAPVGGMAYLVEVFRHKGRKRCSTLKQAGIGVGIAALCAAAIILPFSLKQENPLTWIFSLYGGTLGSYAYATLNTANLYYLADANWTPLTQQPSILLSAVPIVLFAVLTGLMLYTKTSERLCNKPCKSKLLAALFALLTVCFATLIVLKADFGWYGYAMMGFAYLYALICQICDERSDTLPYWMALALIGVYVLGIKVHERYLFPALLLMIIAYIATRDKRVLWVFAGFSATTFINTAIVLDNSILFGSAQGHLNSDTLILNKILCAANLILCVYACFVGMNGLRASFSKPSEKETQSSHSDSSVYERILLQPGDHRLHLTLRDYLIIGITTVLYAMLAFTNLGSTLAPQSAWVSTSSEERVVFELEEPATFSVLYYGGVSYNDFSIAVSDDGVNWSETYPCEMREGLCYRWNYALKTDSSNGTVSYPSSNPSNVLWLSGKYLRVDACNAGLNLWEIVARSEDGNNLPLKIFRHENAQTQLLNDKKPAVHLIDEQNTCVGEPGWFTGTYFDEIYHARTAYEHLHGQAPYETTHPPLGKLMMSVGIAIFGMTPFGWRFAGTLIGVLMLPAVYLLALQLTHKRSAATVALLGLTFDLMHFTQTRIATIDSFPVFFILLTYLFMIRYMQMDVFAVSDQTCPRLMDRTFVRTLIPLLCCGICMGLSIASKWIGIYSAVGLAALFFLTMYRQIRVWNVAWKCAEENGRVYAARNFTINRIAITCAFCVLFFVVIPCLIYGVSYIPYLAPTGPVTLKRIIRAQEGMLSYHSTPGLGMDHPFQSPWWQWPLILKPMWFAQDSFEPAGYASTIMCFGNPWVFYIGAVSMALILVCWIGRYISLDGRKIVFRQGDGNLTYAILAVAFLAQYLPWVLVPRSMYMYHYFASVPFIIIATALLLDKLFAKNPLAYKLMIAVYVAGAVVFFIMFFPYASGYLTSTGWLDAMKWFSKLYY